MHSKGKSEALVMDMLRMRIQSRKSSVLRSHEMGPSCDVFVQIELEQRMGRGYVRRTKDKELHAHADEEANQNSMAIRVAALTAPRLSSN
jgi:hypothetical protein